MIPSRHITQYEWYSIPGGVHKSSQTFTLSVNPINTLQTSIYRVNQKVESGNFLNLKNTVIFYKKVSRPHLVCNSLFT